MRKSRQVTDDKILATAGSDETVRLWDLSTGQPLKKYCRADSSFSVMLNLAFSPDGRTLASSSLDNTIWLWDVSSDRPLGKPLLGHLGPVFSVAFSPDGKTLASGSEDKSIRLWDIDPVSWISRTCTLVNRNLSLAEWYDDIGGNVTYRKTCPALPVADVR
jgi:WD40 repeat protein